MKITARIAYKDGTHRQMMFWYNLWMDTYKQFVEEDNRRMTDYMYEKLMTVVDVLYFTNCIEMPRKKYMEHEIGKVRGWA